MVRLWNWFKNHPGLAGISTLAAIAGLLVATLGLVRDAVDWTWPGTRSAQQTVPAPSAVPTTSSSPSMAAPSADAPATSPRGERAPDNPQAPATGQYRVDPGKPAATSAPTAKAKPSPQVTEQSPPVQVSMSTTSYFFLGAGPIVVAPDNPHDNLRADLQSGPGSLQSRSSTDFAPVNGESACPESTRWTRDPIALGRGSVIDYCLRLSAWSPPKYFKMHVAVDNANVATLTFLES